MLLTCYVEAFYFRTAIVLQAYLSYFLCTVTTKVIALICMTANTSEYYYFFNFEYHLFLPPKHHLRCKTGYERWNSVHLQKLELEILVPCGVFSFELNFDFSRSVNFIDLIVS